MVQLDFSEDDIKNLKTLLQFSKDACPVESLEGNMDNDYLDTLIDKLEKAKHVWFNQTIPTWRLYLRYIITAYQN